MKVPTTPKSKKVHGQIIKSFLDEDISYIYDDKTFLTECLLAMDACSVVKRIHFDPEHPQNHTVRLFKNFCDGEPTSLSAEIHTKSNKWKQVDVSKLMSDLVVRAHHVLNWHKIKNNKEIGKVADAQYRDYDVSLKWLDDIYDNPETITVTKRELYNCLAETTVAP